MTSPDPAAAPQPTSATDGTAGSAAVPDDSSDDAEIVDAEIVSDPTPFRPDLTLPPPPAFDYTDAGVPTLDYVRDRIEGRIGTAHGQQELQEQRAREQAAAATERERLARAKLDEIRKSLGGG